MTEQKSVTEEIRELREMKVPELVDRLPMLKSVYDEQYELAAGEDREKTAERFVPRIARIR